MQLEIELNTFYSKGDERRFFQGLNDIPAIKEIRGVGTGLVIQVDLRHLTKDALRELIALLWRYEISLYPLRILTNNNKFVWLSEKKFYWHSSMFDSPIGREDETSSAE
jgi:hypothetical protein